MPFLQFLVSGEKSFDWSCSLNTSWKHYKCTYGKGSNGEKRLCGILLSFLARFVIAIFDSLESLYYYLYFKQSLSIYPGCCNSSLEPGVDSHCLAVGHCSPSWLRCYHQGLHLFLVCYNISFRQSYHQHLNNFQLLGGEAVRTRELGGSQDGSAFSRSRLPPWLGLKHHQLICFKINHVQQYFKLGNLKSVIYFW